MAPRTYDEETLEKARKAIKAGKTQAEVQEALDVGYSVYYRLKRELRDDGELDADTVSVDKRVSIPKPADVQVTSEAQEESGELARLTDRILDLNELIVDLVMENTRLRRALEDRG